MDKTEYLVKTLSRTKRKDYENYVINRLYHQLDDLDIKPVSQQYAKRKGGGYAMIDLYFPQFNIGIECDEAHHLSQAEMDELRFTDIITAIPEFKNYEEIKIPVTYKVDGETRIRDINEINAEISKVVEEIRKRKVSDKNFKAWDASPDVEKAIVKGELDVEDDFIFTQLELRSFFDKTGLVQRGYYSINDAYHIWLPGLAVKQDDKYIPFDKKKGHLNIISQDGKIIKEYETEDSKKMDKGTPRIVFVKIKDPILNHMVYKFAGVFEKSNEVELIKENEKESTYAIYNRVGTRLKKISDGEYEHDNKLAKKST